VGSTSYRAAVAAAEERLEQPAVPVHRVTTPSGAVEYARYGAGPAVLVVHGSGGGWDQGVDWARRRLLPSRDVLAVSRFGYLGSPLPEAATTSGQADAFAAVLDDAGVERADVVAVSAGSVAAVRFAAEHPRRVRSLLLESPLLPSRRARVLPPVAAVRLLLRSERVVWRLSHSPVLVGLAAGTRWRDLPGPERRELTEINDTMFPLAPRRAGTLFDRVVAAPEMLHDRLPVDAVTCPVLVVNARAALLATTTRPRHSSTACHEDAWSTSRLADTCSSATSITCGPSSPSSSTSRTPANPPGDAPGGADGPDSAHPQDQDPGA
jgi:pimeloyl-ACP methyl ester carboxylesterase